MGGRALQEGKKFAQESATAGETSSGERRREPKGEGLGPRIEDGGGPHWSLCTKWTQDFFGLGKQQREAHMRPSGG